MDLLARFVGIWIVFVIYIAVDVEGAAYGASCASEACTEDNNVCDTGGTNNCKCTDESFRNTETPPACALKIALDGACTTTPVEQCSDANAECSGSTCSCKASHFIDNAGACQPQIGFETNCDNTVTATDQCSVANQECSLESGTNYKCLCTAAYYSGGSSCQARKKPDETGCAAGECVTHATCNTDLSPTKCECNAGYTATPADTPTMCSGVVKFASLSYMYVVPILVSMMSLLR